MSLTPDYSKAGIDLYCGDCLEVLGELPAESVPCVVLDPFAGSGTVGVVAARHGRRAVLIELSPEYVKLAAKRLDAVTWQGPADALFRHANTERQLELVE